MGFGDKLKGLKDQAQQAVAENKDKIQGAVQIVGEAANTKTNGKYATKIAKVGEKVEASVEKIAQGEAAADADVPASAQEGDSSVNATSPSTPGQASAGVPEFE